ncbi:MAG TPA: hypothetical protein VLW50_05505 [Streptosporangiaceae bacterium]|nr:hypothetical protein [Streptosporangiaceae bacterium]
MGSSLTAADLDQESGTGMDWKLELVAIPDLDRERRRLTAARDAAILAEAGADPDMDSLAA